ncbi:AsmA family protein [Commensalibacter oyaizuii]|uniref:AsmA family protein n=1 Tax=Commensalibacter oyaizuii TaxID=3043873 RepID=A0ABT6PZJ6_9PROT|nr:AsmA family protein [Commensalibacter sp. TBRC 16381]MDI2090278.1 AsmA family protein [Commensalibacter sp. TBRC 16381]
MNKKKIFLTICGAVIGLAGVGVVAIQHFADRNIILTQLYDTLEKQTGRKITLQHFNIHFLPWPEIKASNIKLSNIPNSANPDMIVADSLTAKVDLWSLWRQKVHFKSLVLSNVNIHLERNQNGEKNWDFTNTVQVDSSAKHTSTQSIAHKKWKLRFNLIQFNNVQCWFDDQQNHKNAYLHFNQIELNQLETNKVRLELDGSHHQADFKISGRINHFNELLDNKGSLPSPIKFQISFAEYIHNQKIGVLRISGSIQDLIKARGYDLAVIGTILNLNDLNKLFPHANLPSIENITLNAAVTDIANKTDPKANPQIKTLQVHTGNLQLPSISGVRITSTHLIANSLNETVNSQITGQYHDKMFRWSGNLGSLDNLQNILKGSVQQSIPITGKVSSDTYNAQLDGTIGDYNPSLDVKVNLLNYNQYFKDIGDFKAQDIRYAGRMIILFKYQIKSLLNLSKLVLPAIETDGKLTSSLLQINQYKFEDFSTDIRWKQRELFLNQFILHNQKASLKGSLVYSLKSVIPVLTININNSKVPMKWVENQLDLSNLYSGPIELVGRLSTQGLSISQWVKNIKGHIGLSGVDGKLELAGLKHYIGKAAQTLPLNNSLTAQCLAIHAMIDEGQLHFDTLTLQTKQFALNGNGTFNIPNQLLNIHLIPDVTLGAINASAPLRITGTLSDPRTSFDMNKNKVFTLNINPLNKAKPPTNYCNQALIKARTP